MKRLAFSMPIPNVYLFEYDDNETMAKTFVRFQEFYESPVFAGKYFTLDSFKEYYTTRFGVWNYYEKVEGFNIPGKVMLQFDRLFNDLSPEELDVLNLLSMAPDEEFYVIAAKRGDKMTIEHELHHALYYLDDYYRAKVGEFVDVKYPQKIADWLLTRDYRKEVLVDEIAAYLMFDQNDMLKNHGFKEADFVPYIDMTYMLRINYFKTKAKHETRSLTQNEYKDMQKM